jgi:superfamily I DNA/RNA helicase
MSWNDGLTGVALKIAQTDESPLRVMAGPGMELTHTGNLVGRLKILKKQLAKLDGLTGKELVDSLFPKDEKWAQALRSAARLHLEDETTADTLREDLVTRITQPEMPEDGKYVRVMSLHKSKGLTSKVVIVVGCIEGLIPLVNRDETIAEQKATLREQRRLFYVAITRSQELLALSSVTSMERKLAWKIGAVVSGRYGKSGPTIASRFLNELGPTAPRAALGPDWERRGFV